jgi:hypothetical protein
MKKTIIICASLILVATMALVGSVLFKNNSKVDDNGKGKGVITYEQFTQDIRPDLSNEVKEEIEKNYDEYTAAKDDAARNEVLKRLYGMDIFEAKDKTSYDKDSYDKGGK